MSSQTRSRAGASGDRGVSPVIGAVLMFAIVVALAAVVSAMALGFDDALVEPAPQARLDTDYALDGNGNGGVAYVNVTHRGGDLGDGDQIVIRDSDGNSVAWSTIWTGTGRVTAGEYVHLDGKGSDCALNRVTEGETYTVVRESEDGSTTVLETVEIDREPVDPPPGASFTC